MIRRVGYFLASDKNLFRFILHQKPRCLSIFVSNDFQTSKPDSRLQIAASFPRSLYTSIKYRCEESPQENLQLWLCDKRPDDLTEEEIEDGIAYIGGEEYQEVYESKPNVWYGYRRNFKGGVAPEKTRSMCVRGRGQKRKVCSNPCPLCRDEKLLVHYQNVKLLEQFICSDTWEIYSFLVTGICQKKFKVLTQEIEKARDYGLIPFHVPFRKYDYKDYFTPEVADKLAQGNR